MRDFYTGTKITTVMAPAVITADNTPATIDLVDWDGATLFIYVGVGGITFDATNKIEFKITDSNTTTAGDFEAVTAGDILGPSVGTGGIVLSLIAAHAAAAVYRVGYIGNKRYLKLLADFSGTHGTGTMIAAFCVHGFPRFS